MKTGEGEAKEPPYLRITFDMSADDQGAGDKQRNKAQQPRKAMRVVRHKECGNNAYAYRMRINERSVVAHLVQ